VLAAPREHGLSSEIAVNLALALGEDSSKPVLIVDANHVIPSIAALLGVTPPECFAIQMRSNLERRLDQKHWVATSIGFDHVHLLAIDPNTEPEKRRFDPPTFREALAALKRSPYSHVLVDLAPPLLSAGVNLAGEEADGVLLAALARTTRGSHLKQTAERLAPLPVLGTVLFRP
jgi:Mrp family chromosome partitioning ATPase